MATIVLIKNNISNSQLINTVKACGRLKMEVAVQINHCLADDVKRCNIDSYKN
jgi:hypothetical protein